MKRMIPNPIQNEANKNSEEKGVFLKNFITKMPNPRNIKKIYNQLAITRE